MASNNTLSDVDPRIVNPLVCSPEDGVARFPRDSLRRVSVTLSLLSELIGNHNGETELLGTDDHRFALALQLDGMAGTLKALADALAEHQSALHPGEIPIALDAEEHDKLRILAGRRATSVCAVAQGILRDHLRAFRPEVRS